MLYFKDELSLFKLKICYYITVECIIRKYSVIFIKERWGYNEEEKNS
ncbi:hypothetical protein CNEO4_1310025 [Clostridium neonatale]|uniref:Uncharacterized protein n=1 Tax=Clostridium neonatale TaxID=137838 RepID=A0AAD1YH74_9CLOT|nr:hypothetical protein CNEO_1150002 [Clostridium neonatale]CAI3194776.1 hypothetical protein CNEO2_120068 [Clostridium neonatale]CAI3200760.1 hypothetical protein CNEO2_20178 [Clostridium neonatale]CAI3205493.1 hypothetical protein CNEO2_30079 [Clostridium neonatale]CAI3213588.1 hypothetical protein CNEO2_660002 [Clostridium neonatale]